MDLIQNRVKVLPIPVSFFELTELTGIEKYVYMSLLLDANAEGKVTTTIKNISVWLGMSYNSALKYMRALEKKGFINKEFKIQAFGKCYEYTLLYDIYRGI